MRTFTKTVLAAFVGLIVGVHGVPAGAATVSVKTGLLNCTVASGWGYLVGSSRKVVCSFSGMDSDRVEYYTGRISKLGIDLGYEQGGTIVWAVLTPTTGTAPGGLAGTYYGATAGAALGYGAGVNALVGGQANSFSLQPLSVGTSKGLNIAAGAETLTLMYQPFYPNNILR